MKTPKMILLILPLFFSSCVYSHVRTPLDTDLSVTKLGAKKGEASITGLLWLFSWGDAGAADAAKAGGLTTLNHMDLETFVILFGLYSKETVIVYGD